MGSNPNVRLEVSKNCRHLVKAQAKFPQNCSERERIISYENTCVIIHSSIRHKGLTLDCGRFILIDLDKTKAAATRVAAGRLEQARLKGERVGLHA